MLRMRRVLVTIVTVTAGCETVDLRGTLGKTSWQLVQFEGGTARSSHLTTGASTR
jgi:hypothetical protein